MKRVDTKTNFFYRSGLRDTGLPIALIVFFLFGLSGTAKAQSCPAGPVVLGSGQWVYVTGECEIDGDIFLDGTSLFIAIDADLVLRGNITLLGSANFLVLDSELSFDSQFAKQYAITAFGSSRFSFTNSLLRTSLGPATHFVPYYGFDDSTLSVNASSLSPDTDWLIGFFRGRSKVFTAGAVQLPSEVVMAEDSTAFLTAGTDTAVWLLLPPNSQSTMVLPDQSNGPHSYAFGRWTPGAVNIGFQTLVLDSSVRYHIQSRPDTEVTVIGRGKGEDLTGELHIGYVLSGSSDAIELEGLKPGYIGYQEFTHQNRMLRLFNVDLSAIGWSVYVTSNPGLVTIRDSILNEARSTLGSQVEIEDSVLQLAFLGAAESGSMVVRDSHVYSQTVHSESNSFLRVENSFIHGSRLEAVQNSTIEVDSSVLLPNGDGTPCVFTDAITPSGVPKCNPFLPDGAPPVTNAQDTSTIIFGSGDPPVATDLQIVGFATPSVVASLESFTLSAEAGNAGPVLAHDVMLSFRTPPNSIVETIPPGCAASGLDVVCGAGDLSPLTGSGFFTVGYRAITPSTVETNISVSSSEAELQPHDNSVYMEVTVQ